MKKMIVVVVLLSLVALPLDTMGSAIEVTVKEKSSLPQTTVDFTHTVFAEYASTTTCGYCPITSAELYAISQSGDYPFYYVSLVSNKNNASKSRLIHYRTYGVPSVYFDGGFLNITGADTEAVYRSLIEESGGRTVHALSMEVTAVSQGAAQIKITITIKNNGSLFYLGGVHTYITEITSRWHDANGNPYHYACIDIPMQRPLVLLPKGSRTLSMTWDGSTVGFGDIDPNNIKVISSVSHWIPHQQIGYGNYKFYAFYDDQTAGVSVTSI